MKKTIENIIYIIGAILLITIVALKDKYFIMLSIAAVGLIIVGILLAIIKNNYAPVVIPIGVSLGISILLYSFTKIPAYKLTLLFFMLSLAFIMIATVIKYYITLKHNINTHKLEIAAEVTDLVKNPNLETEVYFPVLSYEIDGEYFDINYPVGYAKKDVPSIGDKITINVNPNDHIDVYFKPDKITVIRNYLSSIAVLALVAIVLITLFT